MFIVTIKLLCYRIKGKKMIKISSALCILMLLVSTSVSAYKLSDKKDLVITEKLCKQRQSAEACGKAARLYSNISYDEETNGKKTYGEDNRLVFIAFNNKLIKFYKIGCGLGDKVQCYDHRYFQIKVNLIKQYSSLAESEIEFDSLFTPFNKNPLSTELRQLEKKYFGTRTKKNRHSNYSPKDKAQSAWTIRIDNLSINQIKKLRKGSNPNAFLAQKANARAIAKRKRELLPLLTRVKVIISGPKYAKQRRGLIVMINQAQAICEREKWGTRCASFIKQLNRTAR